MNKKTHIIKAIEEGSIAEALNLSPGDELISINDHEVKDALDYYFYIKDQYISVLIKKTNGQEWELDIEKDYDDDLGIIFDEGLMDDYQTCNNKCIFCFIDQMPPGMRETLYFKDDDSRLSFLQGNYITLTNLTYEEIDRILLYKLSPINISIHTTNEELRCKMLNNRFAGSSLDKIKRLKDGNIEMNGQIVLCKGWNDGKELEKTIHDLAEFLPEMKSVSVVPVGITKFRQGLTELESFTKEDSLNVIQLIHHWQNIFLKHYNTRFIYASDEWYINAGLPIPQSDDYQGYPQIENGVGMVRSFQDEFEDYFNDLSASKISKKISIATGALATDLINNAVATIKEKFPNIEIKVHTIVNNYFGKNITVAGLITGKDLIEQLKDTDLGDYLMLPDTLLRHGEDILLDDIKVEEIEKALQTSIRIVKSDGKSFIEGILSDINELGVNYE